jgi:hypothetical protein
MARCSTALFLSLHFIYAWWVTYTPANAAEFYAVVERNGSVAFCLSGGSILFSDRCAGKGRLTVVEPIKEGTVVWRSAIGTVSLENPPNTQCPLSHAKWDPKSEQVISAGRKITKIDRTTLLKRLHRSMLPNVEELIEDDITAFALDLDNDGEEEIVFVASNLARVDEQWERERLADQYERDEKAHPYVTLAGILPKGSDFPVSFYFDHGDYAGGTDAIGSVTLKGVVSISPGTGEIALLIRAGTGFDRTQSLIRYWHGLLQRIDTIAFTCG